MRFLGGHLGHTDATWLNYPSPLHPSNLNPSTMEGASVFLFLRLGHKPTTHLIPSPSVNFIERIRLPQFYPFQILYGWFSFFKDYECNRAFHCYNSCCIFERG
ncbi:hypothetical protein ACB092_09G046500 [Castanea dentata]